MNFFTSNGKLLSLLSPYKIVRKREGFEMLAHWKMEEKRDDE